MRFYPPVHIAEGVRSEATLLLNWMMQMPNTICAPAVQALRSAASQPLNTTVPYRSISA